MLLCIVFTILNKCVRSTEHQQLLDGEIEVRFHCNGQEIIFLKQKVAIFLSPYALPLPHLSFIYFTTMENVRKICKLPSLIIVSFTSLTCVCWLIRWSLCNDFLNRQGRYTSMLLSDNLILMRSCASTKTEHPTPIENKKFSKQRSHPTGSHLFSSLWGLFEIRS